MQRIFFIAILATMITSGPSAVAGNKKPTTKQTKKSSHRKTMIPERVLTDPNWLMLDHVEAVFKLMKADQGRCEKTLKDVVSYVNKHKTKLLALRKKAQENKCSLCPKAKKKADDIILSRAEKLGDRYGSMMFDYYKKCPNHAERLVSTMQVLGSKCKEDN